MLAVCIVTSEILWDYVVCNGTCQNLHGRWYGFFGVICYKCGRRGGNVTSHPVYTTKARRQQDSRQTICYHGNWRGWDSPMPTKYWSAKLAVHCPTLPLSAWLSTCGPKQNLLSCILYPLFPLFYKCMHNWNRVVNLPPFHCEQFITCTWTKMFQNRDAL